MFSTTTTSGSMSLSIFGCFLRSGCAVSVLSSLNWWSKLFPIFICLFNFFFLKPFFSCQGSPQFIPFLKQNLLDLRPWWEIFVNVYDTKHLSFWKFSLFVQPKLSTTVCKFEPRKIQSQRCLSICMWARQHPRTFSHVVDVEKRHGKTSSFTSSEISRTWEALF